MAATGAVPQFASLYVGDLHADVTEAMLYEIFNSVGPVASIRVCRDSVTRKSLGYAYVNFHAVSDAERALDTLNYSSIKGRSCRIMWTQRDPSMRKSGAGNIYVRNLDRNIDNKALYDTFSLFGNILSCKVASDLSGKSHGYGFVHYETEEAAKQAIERVNGMQIGEKTVEVSSFEKRSDRVKPEVTNFTNVYCKNMPGDWDEEKINEVFGKHGTITSMCIREDKKGRKMAFVNFETTESAQAAVAELHEKEVRSEEQIAKLKEELKEEFKEDVGRLFVQRAQTKLERSAELRDKFPATSRPDSKPQGVNLYVKNLDEGTDEASLRALFESFGQITSVAAPVDDKGKCKGFGFVCFQSPDEATKAVTEMHLKVVKGKPLYVGLAEKREARQERLRQRYSPGAGGDKGGAKGCGKGFGGGCKGSPGGGMGMQGGMGGGMGMMGKGGQQMGMDDGHAADGHDGDDAAADAAGPGDDDGRQGYDGPHGSPRSDAGRHAADDGHAADGHDAPGHGHDAGHDARRNAPGYDAAADAAARCGALAGSAGRRGPALRSCTRRRASFRTEADDRREAVPHDRQVPARACGEDHGHDARDGQQRAPDPPGVRAADEGQD
ncbi:unnamed protein product [Prorocentrum cordatum]|uniref:RRM domain-containing protein n=1 Tax=Prorocentrum cordatum TaxID=2364126 RepID=A0ABN9VCN5_9DINO|nr:unnamed protein product [Polarella glacialis]